MKLERVLLHSTPTADAFILGFCLNPMASLCPCWNFRALIESTWTSVMSRWIWSAYGIWVAMICPHSFWDWISIAHISSVMGQPRAGDFLFLALFCWKSKAMNCCTGLSSLLLCHGTSYNNKIILRELLLVCLESLRALQLPSNAASELIVAMLNIVFLLHSLSLCVKCSVEISHLGKVWQPLQHFM